MVKKILLLAALSFLMCVGQALASDHGCRVLLCFSNPAGPTAVSECVPTYNKLISDMSKPGFSWPTCEEAEASGAKAVLSSKRFEMCPDGYAELPSAIAALKVPDYKNATNPSTWYRRSEETYLKWRYPVYISADIDGDFEGQGGYMVCADGLVKSLKIAKVIERGDSVRYVLYEHSNVYENISLAQRIRAAYVVDVYIDGKLWKRIPINL